MQPDADTIVFILNCAQIFFAASTVLILFLTRVPVAFFSKMEEMNSGRDEFDSKNFASETVAIAAAFKAKEGDAKLTAMWVAALHALYDPLPLWYLLYLAFAIVALFVNRLFLSALLLDWFVKLCVTFFFLS